MIIRDEDISEASESKPSKYSKLVRLLARYVPFQQADIDPALIQTANNVYLNAPLGVTPIKINSVPHYAVVTIVNSRETFQGLYRDPQEAKNEYVLRRLKDMKQLT